MKGDGFVPNPYDLRVFNEQGSDGAQIAVVMHVDDFFIRSTGNDNHTKFEKCMRDKYKEIKIITGKVVDYSSMTFDLIEIGQASMSMDNRALRVFRGRGVAVEGIYCCLHNFRYTRCAKGHF